MRDFRPDGGAFIAAGVPRAWLVVLRSGLRCSGAFRPQTTLSTGMSPHVKDIE